MKDGAGIGSARWTVARDLAGLVAWLALAASASAEPGVFARLLATWQARPLRELAGGPVRIVWVQDLAPRADDVFARGTALRLMALDTADGRGERVLLPGPGSFIRPVLAPDGRRVVYSDARTSEFLAVDWDGANRRVLGRGYATDVWEDPATRVPWVVYRAIGGPRDGAIERCALDEPQRRELLWNLAPVDGDNFQLSADGTRAAGLFPWPHAGVARLPNGGWERKGRGCWTSLAPDNSGRSWLFEEGHRTLAFFDGDARRTIAVDGARGIDGWEVYHPRWSNHPRVFCLTGPYRKGERGRNNVRAGGDAVEVYLGRFDAAFRRVEAWARVTRNRSADIFPDVWVAPSPR